MRLFLKRKTSGLSVDSNISEINFVLSFALSFASKQDKDDFTQALLKTINKWEPTGSFDLKDITEYKIYATHATGNKPWHVYISFNKNYNKINAGIISADSLGENYTQSAFTAHVKSVINNWLKAKN